MHPVPAAIDLVVLVGSGLAVVLGRPRWWGWVLLIASGLWLPLNNAVLEGPVLLPVTRDHGLTLSDLLGVGGAVGAGLRLWPPRRGRSGRWLVAHAAVVLAVVLAGFGTAMLATDVRVEEHEARAGHVTTRFPGPGEDQRSSLDIRRSASSFPPVWQVGQYWNDLS